MSWLKYVGLAVGAVLCLVSAAVGEDSEELKKVTARNLELHVPKSWEFVKPTARFREAEFSIPAQTGDGAELVVFQFGGPTGGIAANIKRWIGQFHENGRQVKLVHGECKDGRYILADISGTWKKPDGPMFAQKTVDKPNSRVINVIIVKGDVGSEDYYFLKLAGPDQLVAQQATALRAAFAAKTDSERPYESEDE